VRYDLRKSILPTCAVIGLASAAHAGPLSVSASVGALPAISDYDILTFDGAVPPGVSLSFLGDAGIVSGSVVGSHAAPYFSGGQGLLEGGPDGPDSTPYLATGTGSATLKFAAPMSSLYWIQGSTDSQNVALFSGASLVGVITGSDIASAPSGSWGPEGTFGVNVTSSVPFTNVVFSSPGLVTSEIDAVAFSSAPAVPEPTSMAVLLAGLLGLAAVSSRARHAPTRLRKTS